MTTAQQKEALKSYGPVAEKLDQFERKLSNAYSLEADAKKLLLDELDRYLDTNKQAAGVIEKLSKDSHWELRVVAASLISHLWNCWMHLSFKHDDSFDSYVERIAAYNKKLDWTLPILERLLYNRAAEPLDVALNIFWDLEYLPVDKLVALRQAALTRSKHKSPRIRYVLVNVLYMCYPSDDEARHILEPAALQFYIDSTYDPDEDVRNQACFELQLAIANLNDDAGKAFLDVINREDPLSDTYMEAVCGAARMGIDPARIDAIIIQNLEDKDCGTGWVDAAVLSHSDVCLFGLISMHTRLLRNDPEDVCINCIEEALKDWNEA